MKHDFKCKDCKIGVDERIDQKMIYNSLRRKVKKGKYFDENGLLCFAKTYLGWDGVLPEGGLGSKSKRRRTGII